jgi:hypothetical protein
MPGRVKGRNHIQVSEKVYFIEKCFDAGAGQEEESNSGYDVQCSLVMPCCNAVKGRVKGRNQIQVTLL